MKDIFIVPLITFNIIIILLLNKYKNSKTGSVIGFCWFVLVIGIFFLFFTHNLTTFQNFFMALFCAAALIYFFYNYKKLLPDTSCLTPHT